MDAEKKQLRNLYKKLTDNENSVLFAADRLNARLLSKLSKSSYDKDQVFYKLFKRLESEPVAESDNEEVPFYTPFVEQRKDIDRSSALYTVDGPLQFFHADLAYLQFFAKSAVDPKYALVCVDLFTSKVYVYTMRTKNNLAKKMEEFYKEIDFKRVKNEKMRLQVDLEFQQNKIRKINQKYNVEMFSTKNRGGKAYVAEQKIREFKKILFRIKKTYKRLKKRLNSAKLIKKAVQNMNNIKTKYGFEPEFIERESLKDENFKERYDFHRLNQVTKDFKRYKRHDIQFDLKRKKRLREPLAIGERVLILASRLKKKDAPGVLYKSTTENRPFFSKKHIYTVRKIVKVNDVFNYWISKEDDINNIIPNRFFREELFALNNQFR